MDTAMPTAPHRPCTRPGCPRFQPCPIHTKAAKAREYDRHRGTAASRGYDRRWSEAARDYLAEHPLCVGCESEGRTELATLVDHVIPASVAPGRFWDRGNWQGLCKGHHNAKTALEARGEYRDYRRAA